MSQWYYAQENQQHGPINEAELKEFLAVGKLPPTVLVWKDGMANWAMANSLPEFQFRPPPMPSAPKPMAPIAPPPTTAAPFTPFVQPEAAAPAASAPAAAATPSAPAEPAVEAELDPEDVNKNKPMAILAYLGLLFIVPLLVAKESPFAKYHTNQGLILFIAGFIVMIACTIVAAVISALPFIGVVAVIFWPAGYAVWLVFAVIGILNAAKGEKKPLPYIGHYTIYS